jgi:hypothetical protein
MANYTEAQIKEAIRNADKAGDSAAVLALGKRLIAMRQQPQPQPQAATAPARPQAAPQQNGRAASFGAGFFSGVSDVSNAIVSAAASLVDRTGISPASAVAWAAKNVGGYSDADSAKIARNLSGLPNFQTVVNAGANANRQRTAANNQAHPNWFAGGQIAGQTFATAPVAAGAGGLIERGGVALAEAAPSLTRVGNVVRKVGAATKTGGIGSGRTAAQTEALRIAARNKTLLQRGVDVTKRLAERSAGGAIAGGASAAATGQNPVEGAAFGGALPVVASPVRKAAGAILDVFRSDKVRAAQMFREALKTNIDAARAAFAKLAPDDQRLARKILADEKIEPDTFMALGADVERLRPEQVRLNQEAETAAARRGLETAAGVAPGGTPADVGAAVRGSRADVSAAMTPARETAMTNIANVNKAAGEAENLLAEARTGAAQQSAVAAQQEDTARRLTGSAALHENSPMFVRGADVAAHEADLAAQEAARLHGVAYDTEDYIHQLNAQDVKPQRGAPLVAALRKMAAKPGTRIDDPQRNSILSIADKIESAMDENGMVDPYDMYQLRKRGLSNAIESETSKITGGAAPRSGTTQQNQDLLKTMQGLIDNTLGPEFKDYLSRSAQGYQNVNRQQLAGEALTRFTAPNNEGFLPLVRNREPKTVAGIMQGGPELENINNAFATDPRFGALTNAANLLESRNRMGELASSGTVAAGELMKQTPPSWLRPFTRMALAKVPAGRIAAEGAGQLAGDLMDQNVRKRLAEGFMSGQNANNLLNTYAAGILTDAQISKLNPYQRNFLAQSMRNYFMPTDQYPNAGY